MAPAMAVSSSGTMMGVGSMSQPESRSASTSAGPLVSSRVPAAERFEQVRIVASCTGAAGRRAGFATGPVDGRVQLPLRPPSLWTSSNRSMTMSRCSALAMSYRVRAATLAAVSASISTPVRAVAPTSAVIWMVPCTGSDSSSTTTRSSGIG